jgi:outer membrane protein assembly factor BamB
LEGSDIKIKNASGVCGLCGRNISKEDGTLTACAKDLRLYPPGQPAHFYLLNVTNGAQIWNYQTPDMNWPMAISSDGKSIVGGGDNSVFYHWQN